MRFSIYQESRTGARKVNQDRMGYCFTRDVLLMLVCDGMGGHQQGEVAAQIALQTIGALFQRQAKTSLKNPARFLEDAFTAAHYEIHRHRAINGLPETPRTTAVACIVQGDNAIWAHAGDSRLYWMRGGKLLAQTQDHSKLQRMVSQGKISEADAANHPERNKIFNCLGAPEDPWVEISKPVKIQPGDAFMLCSDGLWSAVPERIITTAFSSKIVMRAVPDLIQLALTEAGTHSDNVTAIGMTWEGVKDEEESFVNTAVIPAESVTTTIQPRGVPEYEKEASMTDDEIEQAIDEIRHAIRKSTKVL
jgi:serine/threonine protein phosphatase PrpC